MKGQNITIGVDPDSDGHGIAIYIDGKLAELTKWNLMDFIPHAADSRIFFAIENVMANQFIYGRNVKANKTVQSKVAMNIGRCQQAQVELEKVLKHHGAEYTLIKPMKGNWATDKAQFEKVTGWIGRSNADARSAAFMGFLGLKLGGGKNAD